MREREELKELEMPARAQAAPLEPAPLRLGTQDGSTIGGFIWRGRQTAGERSVAIVNPATSVRCRYYFRFAAYLAERGVDVILYDYRGIGESRPAQLAGFRATWLDWGQLDFEAVLQFARGAFPGRPIDVVAHSIGGFVLGLAPSNHVIRRVFTMGAQYAYWRDYAARARLAMWLKWHVVMPALGALFGYVPAARLGWMEDTPHGVALSWSRSTARFDEAYRRGPLALTEQQRARHVQQFAQLRAPLLALSVTDDPFGTVPAIERLLAYFTGSAACTHMRLAPERIGVDDIGHFAFFHRRFESALWPLALQWLTNGSLSSDWADTIVSQRGDALAANPHSVHDASDCAVLLARP